jgi:mono/diheme cytochrome c family protein
MKIVLGLCWFIFASTAAFTETPQSTLTSNPIYTKQCAKCHGKTAEGRHFGGPSLRTEKATTASVNELIAIISNGKGRMPKFSGKLTPEEIRALVEQVKSSAQ